MSSLFGVKSDPGAQRAARKQAREIERQRADEAQELGARRRLLAAKAGGANSLYAKTGAAGVKDSFGG